MSRRSLLAGGLWLTALSRPAFPRSDRRGACGAAEPISADERQRRAFAARLVGKGRRVSQHSVAIRGTVVNYTATVGAIALKDSASEACAYLVYTAYTCKRGSGGERPITFVWDGGPGVASSYLNLSALGPRRVAVDAVGREIAPQTLTDNPDSLLGQTDLVMVDPVGTGFSVAAGRYRHWDFYSVEKDAQSIAQFVKRYREEAGRTQSPVYLLGESYGTIRLPVVITCLQASGIPVTGGIMISSAAACIAMMSKPGNIEPCYLKLPNYAAISWFHKRLPAPHGDLQAHYSEAGHFALNEFLTALVSWPDLEKSRRDAVISRAHRLTGIRPEVWSACRLRLSEEQFARELLQDSRVKLRADDARQVVPTHSSWPDTLPVNQSFVSRYLRDELGVGSAPAYRELAPDIYSGDAPGPHPWDMTDHDAFVDDGGLLVPSYPNYLTDIAEAMKTNRRLRIQQHSGLYDLTCSSFQADWGLRRADVPDLLLRNFETFDYAAGHDVYMNAPAEFPKFTRNLAAFYD